MAALGFGKDIWTIPSANVTTIIFYVWLTEIMYMMCLGLTKIALLAFYLKVFPNEGFRRVCWATASTCLVLFPTFSIFTVFYCTPVSYTWEGWTGKVEGHCLSFNLFAWIQTCINIALDTFILVLPLPLVWRLNMGRKKKMLLMLMFSVGVL